MRKITIVVVLFIVAFYSACSKEKAAPVVLPPAPVENKVPKVSFTTPTSDNGTIWNKFNIEVSASDEDGSLASVELFANGTSQGMLVQSGTTSTYTLEWDSKSIEDGPVKLTVKATDDEKAVVEAVVTVEVYNKLLDYDLYSGYLKDDPNYTYYTYITAANPAPDEDAKILYYAKVTDNAFKAVVERPDDFDEAVFDVHFIEYKKEIIANKGKITSYHNVSPGIFHPIEGSLYDKGVDKGSANITFIDVPDADNQDYTIAINNTNTLVENEVRSFNVFDKFDLGYVYIKNGSVGYYSAVPFSAGDHDLSLGEMSTTMQEYTFGGSDVVDSYSINIAGHIDQGRLAPAVSTYIYGEGTGGNPYETTFHLPKSEDLVFNHYSSTARLVKGNKTYYHNSYFNVLSAITKLNADFTVTDKKLATLAMTVTTSDDFDFVYTKSYIDVNADFKFQWISYSGDNNVFFPPIPDEVVADISDINSSDIVFKEGDITLQVHDYNDYVGYNDYLNRISGRGGVSSSEDRTERLYVQEKF